MTQLTLERYAIKTDYEAAREAYRAALLACDTKKVKDRWERLKRAAAEALRAGV